MLKLNREQMIDAILRSEAEEFLLTEEEQQESRDEFDLLAIAHIENLYRCRFEVAHA